MINDIAIQTAVNTVRIATELANTCDYCDSKAHNTSRLIIHREKGEENKPKLCLRHLLMCIEGRPNNVKSLQETHGNILYTHHYLPEYFQTTRQI